MMDNNTKNVMFSSNTDNWSTPDDLFRLLDDEFHFTLDVCATSENAKCNKFFTKEDDGLSQDWSNEICFMNPPYGRGIKQWVQKAYNTSRGGIVLYVFFQLAPIPLGGMIILYHSQLMFDLLEEGSNLEDVRKTLLSRLPL